MAQWDGKEESCSCDCGFDIPKGGKLNQLTLANALGVASGGTGAKTASQARVNLGIQCGYASVAVANLASLGVANSNQITCPTAFKSTPIVAIAPVYEEFTGLFVYSISNGSSTGFKINATNVTPAAAGNIPARVVHWIAIGTM